MGESVLTLDYLSADLTLDDRIFFLQKASLPNHLLKQLVEADILYLQDKDNEAESLIREIEEECKRLKIYYLP